MVVLLFPFLFGTKGALLTARSSSSTKTQSTRREPRTSRSFSGHSIRRFDVFGYIQRLRMAENWANVLLIVYWNSQADRIAIEDLDRYSFPTTTP